MEKIAIRIEANAANYKQAEKVLELIRNISDEYTVDYTIRSLNESIFGKPYEPEKEY